MTVNPAMLRPDGILVRVRHHQQVNHRIANVVPNAVIGQLGAGGVDRQFQHALVKGTGGGEVGCDQGSMMQMFNEAHVWFLKLGWLGR